MNELATINPVATMSVSDVERVATAIAKGGLFGSKDPNAVLTLCLLAQAEGQHPAVVFRDYHIISGRPAKKADAMLRDFINAGGKVEWHQLDDTCAKATFTHPAGSATIEWDHERAKNAQLGGNAMYRKYPRQMLRSRVISEGVRTVFPGATSGLYEQNEVEAMVEEDGPATVDGGDIETVEADRTGGYCGPKGKKTELRQRANKLRLAIQQADSMDKLKKVWTNGKALVEQLEKEWPEMLDGMNGDDFGILGEKEAAKARLSESEEFTELRTALEEVDTKAELAHWTATYGDRADALGDVENARITELCTLKEAAVNQVAVANT